MQTIVVVVMPVVFHHDTGFAQDPEQFPAEAFVPEPVVEALDVGPVEKVTGLLALPADFGKVSAAFRHDEALLNRPIP
jgi:hypothetical protein